MRDHPRISIDGWFTHWKTVTSQPCLILRGSPIPSFASVFPLFKRQISSNLQIWRFLDAFPGPKKAPGAAAPPHPARSLGCRQQLRTARCRACRAGRRRAADALPGPGSRGAELRQRGAGEAGEHREPSLDQEGGWAGEEGCGVCWCWWILEIDNII